MITADDYVAIQTLYATYNQCVDRDRFTPLAECFSPDAELVSGDTLVVGRTAIHQHFESRAAKQDAMPFTDAQHWVTNLLLEQDGDITRGSCYLVRFAVDRHTREKQIVTLATYDDELVRHDGRWMFSRRRAIPV